MKKCSQAQAAGIAAGSGFSGAEDTMLSYGEKALYMAVAATDKGKGMCNVFYTDKCFFWMKRIKMSARVSGNTIAHNMKCSFL